MALDERYIIASDLEQYFVDKDSGLPLANGTLTFYRDVARNTPKEVFQLSGSPPDYTYTSMGSQITLSAVGTVQNGGGDNEVIYYFPYDAEDNLDLYYVVVANEDGVEQFTREAWPNVTAGNNPTTDTFPTQNQISNPQFTNVFINEGIDTVLSVTAAVSEVFPLGPTWDFVISGTGAVTIQRLEVTGNDNIPTSPPYVLDITVSSGITECLLRQRFATNSGLWASTDDQSIFLSGTLVARSETAGTIPIQMFYLESNGGLPILIIDTVATNSTYTVLSGGTTDPIPASNNTDRGVDGYVDIYLSFSTGTHVRLSSLQVVPTLEEGVNILSYDLNSSNREEALQGDYYIPRLTKKTIPSFLVGWDFPVSPFQFGVTGTIGTAAGYIADQTIALRGVSGAVTWAQSAVTNGIEFTTAGTNDSFYILQYLSGTDVKNMLGTRLSVNVFGYKDSASDPVTMRIYLFRGASAASIPILPTTIGTVATDGVFTLSAANWTAFPRGGLPVPQVELSEIAVSSDINNDANDYRFSEWEITDAAQISDTDKFAIVVTFAYADASTVVTINSISVVPGDLACRPAIKSYDETLRQCQFYYEKSYDVAIQPGSVTSNGIRLFLDPVANNTQSLYKAQFNLVYNQIKRANITPTFYAPDGTLNTIQLSVWNGTGYSATTSGANPQDVAVSQWDVISSTAAGVCLRPNDNNSMMTFAAPVQSRQGDIQFHYVVDGRFGIF